MESAQVLLIVLVLLAGCGAEAESAWTSTSNNRTPTFTPPHDQSDYREPEYPDVERRSDINTTRVEDAVIEEINFKRGSRSLSTVAEDERLSNIGRNYSMTMGKHNFLSHIDQSGKKPGNRLRNHNYRCPNGNEILAETGYKIPVEQDKGEIKNLTTEFELARSIVNQWMDSPEHKEAVLLKGATTIGIGIYVKPDGTVYVTGIICTK
ncbi:MAG: CAP domain-containing protein [Halolamina sp.]